jgi:hypothetical protein
MGIAMDKDVITLGTITIQQRSEENFESYTVSGKKSIGRIIPFQVTDDRVDLRIAYAIFINGERDIRTLEVQKEFNTFGRLIHGLRLAIQPVSNNSHVLYAELRQAFPKESFDKHETLHPTVSEIDLDQGAGLSVFEELKKVGAEVGTKQELLGESGKRSPYLCVRFLKENLWAPTVAYATTRILPISRGYSGSFSI